MFTHTSVTKASPCKRRHQWLNSNYIHVYLLLMYMYMCKIYLSHTVCVCCLNRSGHHALSLKGVLIREVSYKREVHTQKRRCPIHRNISRMISVYTKGTVDGSGECQQLQGQELRELLPLPLIGELQSLTLHHHQMISTYS